MTNIGTISDVLKQNAGPLIVLLLVIALFVYFVMRFWLPSIRLGRAIERATNLVPTKLTSERMADLRALGNEIFETQRLRDRWTAFVATMHPQKTVNDLGEEVVTSWEFSSRPELFFGDELSITELDADFFRHAPGIFTGLGILGTFLGLIGGLRNFKVGTDPTVVQTQLETLINAVGNAFLVSATAIALAMLITAVEKSTLVSLSKKFATLCGAITASFKAYVPLAYLERLVDASETSATQSLQLKDALVVDLKQMLEELVARQAQVTRDNFRLLSTELASSVTDALQAPLAKITSAVDRLSSDQGSAINALLADVLATFAHKMEGLIGSQISGMNDVLMQTSQSLVAATSRFDEILQSMRDAGRAATSDMGESAKEMARALQERQDQMAHMLETFSSRLVDISGDLERRLTENQAQALDATSQHARELIAGVHAQFEEQAAEQRRAHSAVIDGTREIFDGMRNRVDDLLGQTNEATGLVRQTMGDFSKLTTDAIGQLSRSADVLDQAARNFAQAGNSVTATIGSAENTASKLENAAHLLERTFSGAAAIIDRQDEARELLASVVSELATTIDNAKRDAQLTSDLVRNLESAASTLKEAQSEVSDYLAKVGTVLTDAHEKFADNVLNTLNRTSGTFHQDLAHAVGMLSATVKDLEETLGAIPTSKIG